MSQDREGGFKSTLQSGGIQNEKKSYTTYNNYDATDAVERKYASSYVGSIELRDSEPADVSDYGADGTGDFYAGDRHEEQERRAQSFSTLYSGSKIGADVAGGYANDNQQRTAAAQPAKPEVAASVVEMPYNPRYDNYVDNVLGAKAKSGAYNDSRLRTEARVGVADAGRINADSVGSRGRTAYRPLPVQEQRYYNEYNRDEEYERELAAIRREHTAKTAPKAAPRREMSFEEQLALVRKDINSNPNINIPREVRQEPKSAPRTAPIRESLVSDPYIRNTAYQSNDEALRAFESQSASLKAPRGSYTVTPPVQRPLKRAGFKHNKKYDLDSFDELRESDDDFDIDIDRTFGVARTEIPQGEKRQSFFSRLLHPTVKDKKKSGKGLTGLGKFVVTVYIVLVAALAIFIVANQKETSNAHTGAQAGSIVTITIDNA
jgi:hypothetical protein